MVTLHGSHGRISSNNRKKSVINCIKTWLSLAQELSENDKISGYREPSEFIVILGQIIGQYS